MKIATYCITFPEEVEVIVNMLGQAMRLGDVWLFDGGREYALCNKPRRDIPDSAILDVAQEWDGIHENRCFYFSLPWPGNPGAQRNAALQALGSSYDWIIQNDSDELWSNEAVESIPSYLTGLGETTNVLVKMLHLVGDEYHYWKSHHNHLVHARIHRPGAVKYVETWHEHQNFTGHRVRSELTLVHTKHLFVNRLIRMSGWGLDQWHDMDQTKLPNDRFGLSWPSIVYPSEDKGH